MRQSHDSQESKLAVLLSILSGCFHSVEVGCRRFMFTMGIEVERIVRRLEGLKTCGPNNIFWRSVVLDTSTCEVSPIEHVDVSVCVLIARHFVRQ